MRVQYCIDFFVFFQAEAGIRDGTVTGVQTCALPISLGVLLALSNHLPAGAYLRGIRWSGAEWQIDGYAPNASRLVAQLGAAPEFKEVRFLSATTRGALGERTYESFALAFRYAPAP